MSDSLLIENGNAILTTTEGLKIKKPEGEFLDMLRREVEPPINGEAFPDGFKFFKWRQPYLCVVHQLPPFVRLVRWIADDSPAPYGPGTTFDTRRLSFPYAITFAVYYECGEHLSLIDFNELYFRNEPLKSMDDKLGFPALLNVSRIDTEGRSRAWICTQHLECSKQASWTTQLAALLEHTWNGSFNRSSEHHEGASWYGESAGIHKKLHPVANWEEASKGNDAFALGVSWKPAKLNVGQLIDAMLSDCCNNVESMSPLRRSKRKSKPASLVARFLKFIQQKKKDA